MMPSLRWIKRQHADRCATKPAPARASHDTCLIYVIAESRQPIQSAHCRGNCPGGEIGLENVARHTVAIVEDDAAIRDSLRLLLGACGMIQLLRSRSVTTPAIMITGADNDRTLAARAKEAGVIAVLQKPFASAELEGWIRLALIARKGSEPTVQ
jgi:DNA-binding NarL/FixJ family response regulator